MGLEKAFGEEMTVRLFGSDKRAVLALLRAAWAPAVGADLARRTEVLALEGEVLRVRVPDQRWRRVLHRMQPEILSRMRHLAGGLAPRRLGFNEGGFREAAAAVAGPAPSSQPRRAVPTAVVEAAGAIGDAEVRTRFLETAALYLTRNAGGADHA